MRLSANLIVPNAPRLREVAFENLDQKAHFDIVQSNLDEMSRQARSLVAAIALFDFCGGLQTEDRLSTDWQFVAARDGAMSLRNFAHAILKTRGSVGPVPGWLEAVNVAKLKNAHTKFENYFPFAHKLRHSVAHPELYNDPNKLMGSSDEIEIGGIVVSKGGGRVTINQGLFNSTFACTFEEDVIEYDLSQETGLRIIEVCHLGFEAFASVAGWSF